MTYIRNNDYFTEVRRGNVNGVTTLFVIGHNEVHDTTRTTVSPTLTTADLDQSGIHRTGGTPAVVKVASTDNTADNAAGGGMLTVQLQGLDASGNYQTETITLTGTTEVTSSNTYSSVSGLRGLTWGANGVNGGNIWVGTGTFTAGVPATKYAAMDVGMNKAMSGLYTVPLAKTFYAKTFIVNVSSLNKSVEIYVETSSDGADFVTEAIFGLESGTAELSAEVMAGISANSVIRLRAKSSASTTDLTVIMTGLVVDD